MFPFVELHEVPVVPFPGPVPLPLGGSAPSRPTSHSSCFVSSASFSEFRKIGSNIFLQQCLVRTSF